MTDSDSHMPRFQPDVDKNPYRAPAAEFESTLDTSNGTKSWRFQMSTIIQMTLTVAGIVAAFVNVWTIVFSAGPVILLGVLTYAFERRCRPGRGIGWGAVFGLSGPAIAVLCFLLINGMEWSPTDAQHPISFLLLVYGCISLPCAVIAISENRADKPSQDDRVPNTEFASDNWL